MKPQAFIFTGRYGAGKGTQAKLLGEYLKKSDPVHPCLFIEPGKEMRALFNSPLYTAKLTKQVMESGGLMPEFMPIYAWAKVLVDQYTGNEYIFFDGAARKLAESKILESVFPFYGLDKPFVINLDVHHEE